MQDYEFRHLVRVLKLGGSDMVLGVHWLTRYSPIQMDFQQLNISFDKEGRKRVLDGREEEPKLKLISKIQKWLRKNNYGIAAQLCFATVTKPSHKKIPVEVQEVLKEFQDVFQEPKGLPPRRSHDHQIRLKEGAQPFKVRPYRCPFVQ
ncbi:hypothetical protein ACH5RR_007110 [Cinchona calisaya]|uniref:Reverse transcriptase domain-containing protein n=1 Tax=Cinchona calisaya TaxID=153742 RepID=A0ABD3AQZ9_9GENT